jgi:hypothetical protein
LFSTSPDAWELTMEQSKIERENAIFHPRRGNERRDARRSARFRFATVDFVEGWTSRTVFSFCF